MKQPNEGSRADSRAVKPRARGPSAAVMRLMRKMGVMPKISPTERQALEAGHVWIDGDLFAGKADFKSLMSQPYNKLSEREQAFLDGPVVELCKLIPAWEVNQTRHVSDEVLAFIKSQGFMGLLIPQEYGGLGLSATAARRSRHGCSARAAIAGTPQWSSTNCTSGQASINAAAISS